MNVIGCVLGTAGQSNTYEAAYPASGDSSLKTIWRLGYGGASWAGDPNVKATLLRHGNFDYVTNSVVWDSNIPDHTLPASLYLTSKPAWWGNLRWPAIGPDLNPMVGTIPAQQRFLGNETVSPSPPKNLSIR